MFTTKRRNLFKVCFLGAITAPITGCATVPRTATQASATPAWQKGIEGQRRADLGDGTYLNPIVPGDHPDPTILKDGDDYYMTFSSFNSYPGIVIWHSRDLVNWVPIGPALHENIGTVWALDLCKHKDRYYVYIPAAAAGKPWSTFVIWADDIRGPWSKPIDLKIEGCIDPGHIVGEDGKRYLFVNGIRKVRLADSGLATDGSIEQAYSPWRYPDDWITENFAPEGPKLLRRGEWFYLVTAVGGTAGPVTGHMVIAARAKSIHGPWEHCPHNPLVRTETVNEPWWSKGHATLVEGPKGDWWMVYHAYENAYRTLGRQTLLEPIEWTEDGWFRAVGGDLTSPIRKPLSPRIVSPEKHLLAGYSLSDDFSQNKFGSLWSFHNPSPTEMSRVKFGEKVMILTGSGLSPIDSSPVTCGVVDQAYQLEVNLKLIGDAEGGLLLFYNHKAFVGLGFSTNSIKSFQYAEEQSWARMQNKAKFVSVRLINDHHVITYQYSYDAGKTWHTFPTRMEVAGLNHNVFGGFLSLKAALYSVGAGSVEYSNFRYQALDTNKRLVYTSEHT